MTLLHRIGPRVTRNFNTLEEVLAVAENYPLEPFSFDGVYTEVWDHREALREVLKRSILFVVGGVIGRGNEFDKTEPPGQFCTFSQLLELRCRYGAMLGWHTWTHRDLTTLSSADLYFELTPPPGFSKEVAYPYGKFNQQVIECAAQLGFVHGRSVDQGDGTDFQMRRSYIP